MCDNRYLDTHNTLNIKNYLCKYQQRACSSIQTPEEQFNLALKYFEGKDCEKNINEAFRLFKVLADKGFPPAQYYLGKHYEQGDGVEKDITEATRWYTLSLEQGYTQAYTSLMDLYTGEDGKIQAKYFPKAVTAAQQASKLGHPLAQYLLGMLYFAGVGVEKNINKSTRLLELSAGNGCTKAQHHLGLMLVYGLEGSEKNIEKGRDYLTLASMNGEADATFRLAVTYFDSRSTQGISKAVEYSTLAAEQGSNKGQFILGEMYEDGVGKEKDINEALKWYKLSAAQGNPEALAALHRLEGK